MNQVSPVTPSLTPDQKKAADAFFDFLMSDATFFTISGGAGVGKTWLMSYLCKETMKEYETACSLIGIDPQFSSLHFTATTNKAAEVLEQSLGLPVSTIHSFLGLKVKENFKTGKTSIEKTNNWRVRKNIIVFTDECSMVDEPLFKIICESFENSKIVFVGDHAQMAPVGETSSKVFEVVDPANYVFLSQPIRNAGSPPLMALCSQLRETVETGVFKPIKEVPGSIDYLDDDSMPQMLHQHFTNLDPSSRVLCYTNSRVDSFNEFIREEVRGLSPDFSPGDVVVVAQNYTALVPEGNSRGVSLSVERELEILSISDPQEDLRWIDADPKGESLFYRVATVRLLSGYSGKLSVKIPENKERLKETLKVYSSNRDWPSYFSLKEEYADLRDKAACTVYKSQGSTYDSVFIDIGNIGTSYDAAQVARLLYVAASRARHRVFLYGKLPPTYRGKK